MVIHTRTRYLMRLNHKLMIFKLEANEHSRRNIPLGASLNYGAGCINDQCCVLCDGEAEDINHLFFRRRKK